MPPRADRTRRVGRRTISLNKSKSIFTWRALPGGCDPVTPVSGTKSMWCGKWSATGDPWCGWVTLPGYGDDWEQFLESTVNATSVTYTIVWDTEPDAGYDDVWVEWYDPSYHYWVVDGSVNGGAGSYEWVGGPQTDTSTSAFGPTRVRFRFSSDGAYSDEDGLWPTGEGAVKLDDLSLDGGPVEDWEDEDCNAQQSTDGTWVAAITPGFGDYAALHHGSDLVQVDPCFKQNSWLWGFFDDPAVTNYACGGWPLQGAVPYGRAYEGRAMYLDNEIWSPWIPISGVGSHYILEFLTYRDLVLENDVCYQWAVRTRDNDTGGCPTYWGRSSYYFFGAQKDWYRERFDMGRYVGAAADEIQIALRAVDYGTKAAPRAATVMRRFSIRLGSCMSSRTVRYGPCGTSISGRTTSPSSAGSAPRSYARCDMAQDILPSTKSGILPGDSLKITVTDPAGLAADNTAGRTDTKAVYVFVKVTDRFGNPIAGKNDVAIQSPDKKRWAGDATGLLRCPFVHALAPSGLGCLPPRPRQVGVRHRCEGRLLRRPHGSRRGSRRSPVPPQ